MRESLLRIWPTLVLSLCLVGPPAASGQSAPAVAAMPGEPCALESPVFTSNSPNIFNDRQEQDLADALAEYFESDMRVAEPAPDDQLTRIGERLLAVLPPTGLHYRFRIYDSGEVNGFSIGGGRVYISRKLIAAVKNEDQLAGVVAHEIGHISTHQTALEFTRAFRLRLGVTQVTDRADIFAKVHQWFSTPPNPKEEVGTEEKDELVADHVAFYAMVRAGYAPESFASFLNEIMLNRGKTGNWLTDLFGQTHEASQRYRSALKLIATLPAACRAKQPRASDAFLAWQKSVVEERVKMVASGSMVDQPVKLDPPLRPSLWRIRFSPDGHRLLAQDEGSISVVDRDKAKVLFRIDAPDAEAAQFTQDSASVVFHDSKLRVERWSVASGSRASVKEMVIFDGCGQTLLVQDGKTLVCANLDVKGGLPQVRLRLIDVESGEAFYQKPTFWQPNVNQSEGLLYLVEEGVEGLDIAAMAASPDGRYLLVLAGPQVLAYDLERRTPISLGGKLKDLTQQRLSFVGPDQLFVVGESKDKGLWKTRLLSFPEGTLIKEWEIGDQQIGSVTKGRFLIAEPLKDYAVGILDPETSKFTFVSKSIAVDLWDKYAAVEDAAGALAVGEVGATGGARIPLPLGPLPNPRAAGFSPDGKYLAVSTRNRAQIWELATGKQVRMIRPFRSVWMDDHDNLFGQFPKYTDKDPIELRISLEPVQASNLGKFEPKDWQYHNMQYRFQAMGRGKGTYSHATLEVKNMETQTVAWTRDYPHETPACWPAEDDRMVLAWDLTSEAAKGEIKAHPELQKELDALGSKKKGLLMETVAPDTGRALQQVIVPEADLTKGTGDVRRARVSGDYVLVAGEHGNTVIYRIGDGVKVGEFFGWTVATDAGSGMIAAENRDDEILLVNEHTGKELQRFTLGAKILLGRIVNGKEKALLVLTDDQVVHQFRIGQTSSSQSPSAAAK